MIDSGTNLLSPKADRFILNNAQPNRRQDLRNFLTEMLRQYRQQNPDGVTFKGSFKCVQNMAMMEGILTHMSATLSSQAIRYFDEIICERLKAEMEKLGISFEPKIRSDQSQTSDDLIFFKKIRINKPRCRLSDVDKIMQKYISELGKLSQEHLDWSFKSDLF